MSRDLGLQMYEVQAELIEVREELGKIRKENNELKNQMVANNLGKTGQRFKIALNFSFIVADDFQRKHSKTLEFIQEKLSIHCNR